jgi:hypothetical protein
LKTKLSTILILRCISKFSHEEVQAFSAVLNGIAQTECFKSISEKSCGDYVNYLVDSLAGGGNSGSGRDQFKNINIKQMQYLERELLFIILQNK